jgi:hypothetical protein
MSILNAPETWVARKLRKSAITYWLRLILVALAVVDVVGALNSVFMMIYTAGSR